MNNNFEEDLSSAKLKGYNCYLKFHDGEILFFKSAFVESNNDWFVEVEDFINSSNDANNFPEPGIAIDRKSIKYVRQI
jgi:hypothetical protein